MSATSSPPSPTLSFIVIHSAQVDPEGFTLAFFESNTVIDARGRVLQVTHADDFEGLVILAEQTSDKAELPETGNYLNTWRIKQMSTAQPVERMYVPRALGSELKVTSVQCYDGLKRELKETVGGLTELPEVLCEVFALVLEARTGYAKEEEDKEVIRKVKAILVSAN